jgi:hypothetical protein
MCMELGVGLFDVQGESMLCTKIVATRCGGYDGS